MESVLCVCEGGEDVVKWNCNNKNEWKMCSKHPCDNDAIIIEVGIDKISCVLWVAIVS